MQILKLSWGTSIIRELMAIICQFLYPLISNIFSLFINISKVNILSSDQLKPIYSRVTLILTIVMVFYVTFECVKYIVQPDAMTDKEKGVGNIVYKMIIVVVLIAFVPTIFEWAYKIQNVIIDQNVIGKVILGTNIEAEPDKLGSTFASNLLGIGYSVDDDKKDESCGDLKCGTIVSMNLNILQTSNKLPYLSMGLDASVKETTPTAKAEKVDVPAINFEFHGILSVVIGLIVGYILVLYCVDIGVRWAQLIYLQVIAPIPIIGYLSPKKDGIFQKWLKQCTTTYLGLFLRTAIIYLVLLLSSLLLDAYHNPSTADNMFANVAPGLRTWVFIFLVLGVMMFAKKAPELLSELFPKSGTVAGGKLGLSSKDRIAPTVARAAGATIGAGIVGAKGLISGSVNQTKRNWRNWRTGTNAENRRAYKDSRDAYRQEKRDNRSKRMENRFKSLSFDKNERQAAQENLQKLNNNLRDKRIDMESAKADRQNTKFRFGSVAGVTGAVGGVVRGATAGVQATDLKGIQKQVSQGLKNESASIAKTEKWYNEGGGSNFDRMKSGIEQSLGISTNADAIANQIKHEDEAIKSNEALIATETGVKKSNDEVEGRLDSKLNTDSKAMVDQAAEAYLSANVTGIDIRTGEKMTDLRKRCKAKTETAQSALNEAVKQSGGRTDTPAVEAAQEELRKARIAEEQVNKFTMRAAYTQILGEMKDPTKTPFDPVAAQRIEAMLESMHTARRSSQTVRSLEAKLQVKYASNPTKAAGVFNAFMNGDIEDYDTLDDINSTLQTIAAERNNENARRRETKRKLESSSAYSAAKADNSASGKK